MKDIEIRAARAGEATTTKHFNTDGEVIEELAAKLKEAYEENDLLRAQLSMQVSRIAEVRLDPSGRIASVISRMTK